LKEEKLIRFLNNRTSPKENREVLEWLSQDGSEERFVGMLQRKWDSENSDHVDALKQKKLLDRIHSATLKSRKIHKGGKIFEIFLKYGKVAATYLLFVFSAYFLFEAVIPKEKEEVVMAVEAIKIHKRVALGEKLKLTLPDKSEVIVNSLSTISFDSDFGVRNRDIELDGEAFFSVAPDKEKPFRVKTGSVTTTALGTSFNAFVRESEVRIALTEGKVSVGNESQLLSLVPGEMASLQEKDPMNLKKGKFDPAKTTLWKEGKIQFQSQPFGEVLNSLEKWYGVQFVSNANDNRKVTGLFTNESLEEILTGLSFSLVFEYEINDKNVIIKF
jgi:ferric-dicitrate binding protein FerR (iron transport regulator)